MQYLGSIFSLISPQITYGNFFYKNYVMPSLIIYKNLQISY